MPRLIQRIEHSKQSCPRLLRVAAYARVSSGKDAMLHSLSAQVGYYTELIQSNPEWQLIGIYSDEALTGTKETRNEFQRMLTDCREGKIDLILTKSISRFARNTVTLLETVRELKLLNNEKYTGNMLLQKFYNENHITKKKMVNNNVLEQYYVQDSHPAIINTSTFETVENMLKKRSEQFTAQKPTTNLYPFSGIIHCCNCGKNYRRKTTPTGVVWVCSTYNTKGKKYCPTAKQIPETTLLSACCDVLKLLNFNVENFNDNIKQILVTAPNELIFLFHDGRQEQYIWKDRSRSESWTDEMKTKAADTTKTRRWDK